MEHVPPTGFALAHDDHRHATRKIVRLRAKLREGTQLRVEVDVTDLSATGFRAQTSHPFRRGALVSFTLPGFSPLEAVVAWQRGSEVGCSFRNPLHPAVFDHIVAAANRR